MGLYSAHPLVGASAPKLSLPPFLEEDDGTLVWNPFALSPGLSEPCPTLCFVQPLLVSHPD
jgi:hypothetical protein